MNECSSAARDVEMHKQHAPVPAPRPALQDVTINTLLDVGKRWRNKANRPAFVATKVIGRDGSAPSVASMLVGHVGCAPSLPSVLKVAPRQFLSSSSPSSAPVRYQVAPATVLGKRTSSAVNTRDDMTYNMPTSSKSTGATHASTATPSADDAHEQNSLRVECDDSWQPLSASNSRKFGWVRIYYDLEPGKKFRTSPGHVPMELPVAASKTRVHKQYCVYCTTFDKVGKPLNVVYPGHKAHKIGSQCRKCKVFLCFSEARNCWAKWHSDASSSPMSAQCKDLSAAEAHHEHVPSNDGQALTDNEQ